jgi:hypothetical protein
MPSNLFVCVATSLPSIQHIVHQSCEETLFLSGDLVKRDGSWLLEGIQSKWCEKTSRVILALLVPFTAIVSLHIDISCSLAVELSMIIV